MEYALLLGLTLIATILFASLIDWSVEQFAPSINKRKPCTTSRRKRQEDAYKYTPLRSSSEIRLLTLKPGSGDSRLVCKLHPYKLLSHKTPSYQAISYVWGSTQVTHAIICDRRRLDITTNLRNALQRVRSPSEEIYLWADAICIYSSRSGIKDSRNQRPFI